MSEATQKVIYDIWNMTLAEVLDIDEECIKTKRRLDEVYNILAKGRAGEARRIAHDIKGDEITRKEIAFKAWMKAMEKVRAKHRKAVDEAAKAGLFGRGLNSYPALMGRYASMISLDSRRQHVC